VNKSGLTHLRKSGKGQQFDTNALLAFKVKQIALMI